MSQEFAVVAEQVSIQNVMYGGVVQSSVSVATASGTTIPLNGRVMRVSATAATTSASCTLAAGSFDGQTIFLVNESSNNVVISGNMKGSAAATVSGSQAACFVWVATSTGWFVVKG